MKIKIINPNTSEAMTKSIHRSAIQYSRPDTEICTVSVKSGPISIENFHDQFASIIGVIEEIRADKYGYDAFIVAAACDPGLAAAREIVRVPVIGIGEAAIHLASLVAAKFTVVTVFPRIVPLIEKAVEQSGLLGKCSSVRSISACVLDTENNPELVERELMEISLKALECDKAEAICLGCSGMTKFAEQLEQKLGVPVFDGVVSAVKLAESLVDIGKTTSKRLTYQYPSAKKYCGIAESFEPDGR